MKYNRRLMSYLLTPCKLLHMSRKLKRLLHKPTVPASCNGPRRAL